MSSAVRLPRYTLVLLGLQLLVTHCNSQGLTVIGPKYIQPNRPYTVAIINSLGNNTQMEVTLSGPRNVTFSEQLAVSKSSAQSTTFKIGNIPKGRYRLKVRSDEQDILFAENIYYSPKTMSVFIQTDKPVYKPGDMLRFRIVAVDIDTRPLSDNSTISIGLRDAKGNSIRQWPYARLVNGVFQSAIQLASSPVLGEWNLMVSTVDGVYEKQIELREYVLPKFYIRARAAETLLIEKKRVAIAVESYYTFGKQVDGKATVDLYLDAKNRKPDYTTTTPIMGATLVEFTLDNEIELEPDELYTTVIVKISVEEAFTNRSVNIVQPIQIYRYPYEVTLIKSVAQFRPGTAYPVQISVLDHAGEPVTDQKDAEVTIRYEGDDVEIEKTVVKTVNPQGLLPLTLEPPTGAEQLSISVKYDSVDYETISTVDAALCRSKQYIRIAVHPKYRIRADKDVLFDVTCTESMSSFSYIIVSRGAVLLSGSTKVYNKKKYSLRLRLTSPMAPTAKIIVFYVKDGYLIFDSLELDFESFNNEFKFTLDSAKSTSDTAEYIPGQGIYIDVETAKDSYVAFQAIDQSALLLGRTENDLSKEDILTDISQYEGLGSLYMDPFRAAGLFVKTTAKIDQPESNSLRSLLANHLRQSKSAEKATAVRTVFPESWLWTDFMMDGKSSLHQLIDTVPDTITSWIVTGFSLSPTLGLGVARQPQKFVIKQPFYIVANLPYSIKRGEVALIQVTVFNFLGNAVTTEVTLYNKNEEIEFVEKSSADNTRRSKSIIVPGDNGKPISFMIKAKKLGEIAIKIEAINTLASDALEHMLRVTPESRVYEKNEARFIELDQYGIQRFDLNLNIPREIDEGSTRIKFVLDADIFGTAIQNLDALIRLPTGCGEQNMMSFVPNVVILDYLTATGMLTDEIKVKAIQFLTSGYQNQLNYKLADGSFSVFERGYSGSTFLTAFVANSFKMAEKYIDIDPYAISDAFYWLANLQGPDGKFEEVGRVFHADMQGGLRDSCYALTSFVLVAFSENKDIALEYNSTVERAISYLVNNFENMDDAYDLALATYALSLNDHPRARSFLDKLVEDAVVNMTDSFRYWEKHPVGVEVAGYALLSYITQDILVDAAPIMRWMNSKRYDLGAFPGTQDTFVGLKALSKYAAKTITDRNDYRVTLRYKPAGRNTIDIDKVKSMVVQEMDLPSNIRQLNVEIEGVGVGWFQVAYQYSMNIQQSSPSFELEVKMLNTSTYHMQHLEVCVAYIPKEAYQLSNMALVEVSFPSGLMAEQDAIEDLSLSREIRKTELRNAATSVVVYYDNLGVESNCFKVTAYRRFKVAMHRPAYVVVYDYYDQDRFAVTTYEGKIMQLCDICEDEDCSSLSC